MKGIMVTLLVFAMTGIVVGQQPNQFNSNDFSSVSTSAGTGVAAAQDDRLAPYELQISAGEIQGLKKGGTLKSSIVPRDPRTGEQLPASVINGITIVHQNNDGRDVPSAKLRGTDNGDGVLRFGLTDLDLYNLESKRLSFDFEPIQRGKYERVEFFYVGDSGAPSVSPTPDDVVSSGVQIAPRNDNSVFGPRRESDSVFGQQRTSPASNFNLPAPGPAPEPGDLAFMGPVMPSRPVDSTNPWTLPRESELERQRREIADLKARQEERRKALLAQQQQAEFEKQQRELAELRAQNQLLENDLSRQTTLNAGTNQWNGLKGIDRSNDRDTLTLVEKMKQQQARDLLSQRELDLLAAEKAIANREAQLKREEEELARKRYLESLRTNPAERRIPANEIVQGTDVFPETGPVIDRQSGVARNQNRPLGPFLDQQSPQQRLVSNTTPKSNARSDMALSVPGDTKNKTNLTGNTQSTRRGDTEGFIYFLLLCSLGLNVYLSWISRGFYVRYHELADELRETFTTTR